MSVEAGRSARSVLVHITWQLTPKKKEWKKSIFLLGLKSSDKAYKINTLLGPEFNLLPENWHCVFWVFTEVYQSSHYMCTCKSLKTCIHDDGFPYLGVNVYIGILSHLKR